METIHGLMRSDTKYLPLTGPDCAPGNRLVLKLDKTLMFATEYLYNTRLYCYPETNSEMMTIVGCDSRSVMVRPTIMFLRSGNTKSPVNILLNAWQNSPKVSPEWFKTCSWEAQIPANVNSYRMAFAGAPNFKNGFVSYFEFFPQHAAPDEILTIDNDGTFVEFLAGR